MVPPHPGGAPADGCAHVSLLITDALLFKLGPRTLLMCYHLLQIGSPFPEAQWVCLEGVFVYRGAQKVCACKCVRVPSEGGAGAHLSVGQGWQWKRAPGWELGGLGSCPFHRHML